MIVRPRHFVAFVAAAGVWAAAAVAGISHLVQAATIPAWPARSSSNMPRPSATVQDGMVSAQGMSPEREAGESLMLRPSPGLPELAAAASHLCGVDADVYAELIGRESSWRQTDAQGRTLRSKAGALGLSQIKASTAAEISPTLRTDVAADNAIAGACHLRRLVDRFGGSYRVALAAYVIGANSPHLHTSPKARAYADGILAAAEARR